MELPITSGIGTTRTPGTNGNQINQQISTGSAWNVSNVMMEDDDDETWGKWKPDGLKEHKEPVPEPKEPPAPKEPDVKRPVVVWF